MPRQLRIQYEGAIYHLMNRGDRHEEIFRDEVDRRSFLQTLGVACEKTDWQVHAYCLMNNHFHLVVETPRPNLVQGMKWLLGTYTIRFNRRHKITGHLFAGRYKSLLIDETKPNYLRTVCDYVHLNPVRARLLRKHEQLEKYVWSSYPSYLRSARQRETWLRCDRVLGERGLIKENRRSRLEFARSMQDRCHEAQDPWAEPIRRGWCFGGQDFVARLLDRLQNSVSEHHHSVERSQTEEQKAEKILRAGLAEIGWRDQELRVRRKSDRHKVMLAKRLRSQTAVSLKWIAQHLEMGSWTHVSNLLQASRG
jgi:putative transposase